MDEWSESSKLYTPRHTLYAMGILTDLFFSNTDSYIEACFRPPTSWRENRQIFSHLSVCSGGGWGGGKVQNIGGPRGGKLFAGFKLIGAPESNQCQIIALGLQLPGGKIDKYSPICLSVQGGWVGGGGGGRFRILGVRGGPNSLLALN